MTTRAHLATVEGAPGRNKRDLVIYDGALVFAKAKGGRRRLDRLSPMTPGQVVGLHSDNVLVHAADVESVDVWERFPGGELVVTLQNGVEHRFAWLDRRDRKVDVAEALVDVLPGRVAVEPPERSVQIRRALKIAGAAVVGLLLLVALFTGIGKLLEGDPPPPPPPAPTTTVSPAQQTVRDTLGPACGPWRTVTANLAPGARPDPAALRPAVEGLRQPLDAAAAADPTLVPARDALAELLTYARGSAGDAALASAARLQFLRNQVDGACAAAGA